MSKIGKRKVKKGKKSTDEMEGVKDGLDDHNLYFLDSNLSKLVQSITKGFSSCPTPLATNYSAITLQEVSLEGLDGITKSMLKHRLKTRHGFQPNLGDELLLEILNNYVQTGRIMIYELTNGERKFVKPYNRYIKFDADGVIMVPGEPPEESYPLNIVDKDGIKGSCLTFDTRIPHLEILKLSHFNDDIVFVASQTEREKTILGSNYDPLLAQKISPIQWAILERIGRSRQHGEITVGGESLVKYFQLSPRDLFYYRKLMLKNGLITKQSIIIRSNTGQIQKGLLFHLPHYFEEWRPKSQQTLYELIKYLKENNGLVLYDNVKDLFGPDFRKDLKHTDWRKYVETDKCLPYSEIYPDSDQSKWKAKNGNVKLVKMVVLYKQIEMGSLLSR